MEHVEPIELRLKMVDMHDYLNEKISNAMEAGYYLEASWLIYSCLENRFFRVLDKYKRECTHCTNGSKCRKSSNQLALSTKVNCVDRLRKAQIPCVSDSFDERLLASVKAWTKQRNTLMHNLLALDKYQDHFDHDFEKLAREGSDLLDKVYRACTDFRQRYFAEDYTFYFPKDCMDACPCNPDIRKPKGGPNT